MNLPPDAPTLDAMPPPDAPPGTYSVHAGRIGTLANAAQSGTSYRIIDPRLVTYSRECVGTTCVTGGITGSGE